MTWLLSSFPSLRERPVSLPPSLEIKILTTYLAKCVHGLQIAHSRQLKISKYYCVAGCVFSRLSVPAMASIVALQAASVATLAPMSLKKAAMPGSSSSKISSLSLKQRVNEKASRGPKVVCAVGDVSAEGTNYLIAGAIAIALVGTALPILFSRKDLCPECDGAGFVRKTGSTLNANAARKDLPQIVCKRCNGLGKIGQVDKA